MGTAIEAEFQYLATTILTYLKSTNINAVVCEEALDVIRCLPARTEHEIQFVWQIIDGTTDNRVHAACADAFSSAKPENDKAWEALKQGMMSHTSKVRDVVEKLLKRAQRI